MPESTFVEALVMVVIGLFALLLVTILSLQAVVWRRTCSLNRRIDSCNEAIDILESKEKTRSETEQAMAELRSKRKKVTPIQVSL